MSSTVTHKEKRQADKGKRDNHDCTWSEEYGQAKINGLKGSCFFLVCKQEILWFEVPVHHSMLMAHLALYRTERIQKLIHHTIKDW